MTSQSSTSHFFKSTWACPAPWRPVRDNERTFQVATLSSPVRDRVLVIRLIFCLRRLSGRALLLPFLSDLPFLLPILCLVHLSRYMTCVRVSSLSGFSTSTLRRPHISSPPACQICCLLTLVHLQTARFSRRCPETGETSTTSGLSLKPITANAVCCLGHRQRPYPLRYCCVGGCLCRWFPPA